MASIGSHSQAIVANAVRSPPCRSMKPWIDEEPEILHHGLLDESLLMRQQYHRSKDIWNGEDPGPLTCRGSTKELANIQMRDNRLIDIIKLLRLEGLFRTSSREIDHCLISALV
nr:hypothetical protein CFP56_56121 [Quercus suber]